MNISLTTPFSLLDKQISSSASTITSRIAPQQPVVIESNKRVERVDRVDRVDRVNRDERDERDERDDRDERDRKNTRNNKKSRRKHPRRGSSRRDKRENREDYTSNSKRFSRRGGKRRRQHVKNDTGVRRIDTSESVERLRNLVESNSQKDTIIIILLGLILLSIIFQCAMIIS